jgi:hypothetical protein
VSALIGVVFGCALMQILLVKTGFKIIASILWFVILIFISFLVFSFFSWLVTP